MSSKAKEYLLKKKEDAKKKKQSKNNQELKKLVSQVQMHHLDNFHQMHYILGVFLLGSAITSTE
jgi:DNA polymerase III delta prime subunit